MGTAIILIKLIAAHLVGDFILQTDKMCTDKSSNNRSVRYRALAEHAVVQAALAYLFVAQWNNWFVPLAIGISHFLIDLVKVHFKRMTFVGFICDQLAHYCVIIALWFLIFANHDYNPAAEQFSANFWLVATAYIAVLSPTSILIKSFIEYEKWLPTDASLKGLPNAGKWIGYLERILILTFVFTDNIEGVGFLLAAKSVFRFGELNRTKDIKTTEYVLIGTFTSFTIAILLGFGIQWLMAYNLR